MRESAYNGFIRSWNVSAVYTSYFSACNPSLCTYITSVQPSIIDAVSVVIGLLGGLSIALRIVVQVVTEFVLCFCRDREKRRASRAESLAMQQRAVSSSVAQVRCVALRFA